MTLNAPLPSVSTVRVAPGPLIVTVAADQSGAARRHDAPLIWPCWAWLCAIVSVFVAALTGPTTRSTPKQNRGRT